MTVYLWATGTNLLSDKIVATGNGDTTPCVQIENPVAHTGPRFAWTCASTNDVTFARTAWTATQISEVQVYYGTDGTRAPFFDFVTPT